MAKINHDLHQFGSAKPANTGGSQHCAECEAMLADVLDGTLSTEEQAQFDLHLAGCTSCSQMLADAQRGAAWLELLRTPRPEPPAALLERILAQTGRAVSAVESGKPSILPLATVAPSSLIHSGSESSVASLGTAAILPFRSRVVAAFRGKSISQSMLQPRLAMTAAMAFFSIGLTLNLTGVRLNEFHASDLKPSSLRRSFYQANAHVVRYYDNLRVVYELESRVRDLQRSSESDHDNIPAPAEPEKKPADDLKKGPKTGEPEQKQSRPRSGSGTSRWQQPADPDRLAAFRLVGTTPSPAWRLVCASSAVASISSTLQEGESV